MDTNLDTPAVLLRYAQPAYVPGETYREPTTALQDSIKAP